jgi:hypothetical protein
MSLSYPYKPLTVFIDLACSSGALAASWLWAVTHVALVNHQDAKTPCDSQAD